MYKAQILIISERKEQSIKYKKLIEAQNQDVVISNNLSDALFILQKQEIEFIIISELYKGNKSIKKLGTLFLSTFFKFSTVIFAN